MKDIIRTNVKRKEKRAVSKQNKNFNIKIKNFIVKNKIVKYNLSINVSTIY